MCLVDPLGGTQAAYSSVVPSDLSAVVHLTSPADAYTDTAINKHF